MDSYLDFLPMPDETFDDMNDVLMNILSNLNIELDVEDVLKSTLDEVETLAETVIPNEVSHDSPPKTSKKRVRTQKQAVREQTCKLRKTIFKKVAQYIQKTERPTIVLTQDIRGDWEILGSPALEEKIMKMRPLIDIKKENILQDNDLKALSLKPSTLPETKQPQKSPFSCTTPHDIDFTIKQGPSASYPAPQTPKKLFKRKAHVINNPKKNESKKKKKIPEILKAEAQVSSGSKRPKRRASKVRAPSSTSLPKPSTMSKTKCPGCKVNWDEMNGDRCVQCVLCSLWVCSVCSKTKGIPKRSMDTLKWKCDKCRKM